MAGSNQQHVLNMPPSSMGGGASCGLNLVMPKPFQQHTLSNPSLQDPNIDVHGRFQIQRSISNQTQNIINSKGGPSAPSSGPAHSLGSGMGQTYNQSIGMMQPQSHPYHNSKGRPQNVPFQQQNQ